MNRMKKIICVFSALLIGVTATAVSTRAAAKKVKAAAKRVAVAAIAPLGTNTVRGTFRAWEEKSVAVSVEVTVENLKPGKHGAHIHSGGSCGDDGKAAGPHWDPNSTGKHGNPSDPATVHHAADMPNLNVDAKGNGGMKFTTTNFKLADLIGKTIVIHDNFDNYTDSPANGGSGPRIGCGVIGEKGAP